MFRLLAGAARIIAIALAGLLVLAINYPYWAAGIAVFLVAAYIQGLRVQRAQVLSLDLRTMSPVEYEKHCTELLRAAGWSVRHIGHIGDQGIDVLAELRGTKAAIQCKKYAQRAGNAAVQEVVAGKRHYGAQIAVVVAPNGFTRAAHQLAKSNAVLLMSHDDLRLLEVTARVP